MPVGQPAAMLRMGKKAAGRSLDGRTHDAIPASAASEIAP
jgi:protein gp37